MADERFSNPRLAINRVYTKRGDKGETSLVGGQRLPKDSPRIGAYGTVDELNCFVGVARASADAAGGRVAELAPVLLRIQNELFNLGSILATLPADVGPRQPRITEAEIRALEADIDRMNESLAPLRSFVLPGGTRLNAELHVCRAVCRRAEREVVALARVDSAPDEAVGYLNRLSDAFFVFSRWASAAAGADETLWDPNR
jgi:cob(I)alamin adenosyltransferase